MKYWNRKLSKKSYNEIYIIYNSDGERYMAKACACLCRAVFSLTASVNSVKMSWSYVSQKCSTVTTQAQSTAHRKHISCSHNDSKKTLRRSHLLNARQLPYHHQTFATVLSSVTTAKWLQVAIKRQNKWVSCCQTSVTSRTEKKIAVFRVVK